MPGSGAVGEGWTRAREAGGEVVEEALELHAGLRRVVRSKEAKDEGQLGARRPRARGAFAQYRRQEDQEDQEDQCIRDTCDRYDSVDTLWSEVLGVTATRGGLPAWRGRAGAGQLQASYGARA